ncbi:MAG: aminopeptidase P N-terminal domain-containing protein [Bacteroidota bacterium]
MKTIRIDNSLFKQNRERLLSKMDARSVAVVNANLTYPTNADGTYAYKPNSDLFYLTGIEQEETSLLLVKESATESKTILFIKPFDPLYEKWMGKLLTVEDAQKIAGIDTVLLNTVFETTLHTHALQQQTIYLNANEHLRAVLEAQDKDAQFAQWCKQKYPMHTYKRLAPIISSLRMVKNTIEIELMQQAASITTQGFLRLLQMVKPGMWEYEIEAELLHQYYKHGTATADYHPIVASGADSCILHYTANSKQCKAGDVLLIDAAARWANYNADLTRVMPVSGQFTQRQKQVYNAVLRVNKTMQTLMLTGALLSDLQQHCFDLLLKELVDLGLASKEAVHNHTLRKEALQTYCYHNFSHFLGLSVHDVGDMKQPLQAGMVLTNEPGIYIAAENIGIRIENNILITDNGNYNLQENTPIEAEHIETLMNT